MLVDHEQINQWLESDETEHLEFKAARDSYSRDDLIKYCCALANENGGYFVLGISDKMPRKVPGSNAFQNLGKIKEQVISALGLRIDADIVDYQGKRVVVFNVPARPIGVAKSYDGVYWMRRGQSLVPMTQDMLKRIFDEAVPDFSAQICDKAKMSDLAVDAIEDFRNRWISKSGNKALYKVSIEQLLRDAELVHEEGITYAALVLFGTKSSGVKPLIGRPVTP